AQLLERDARSDRDDQVFGRQRRFDFGENRSHDLRFDGENERVAFRDHHTILRRRADTRRFFECAPRVGDNIAGNDSIGSRELGGEQTLHQGRGHFAATQKSQSWKCRVAHPPAHLEESSIISKIAVMDAKLPAKPLSDLAEIPWYRELTRY